MNVASFERSSCNFLFLSPFFYRQAVGAKLYSIYPSETAPDQVFLSIFFNIKRINRVLYINLVTSEKLSFVNEWPFRFVRNGGANSAGPFTAPNGHGVIKYILSVDVIDVWSPDPAFRFKVWPAVVIKSGSDKLPIR